MPGWCMQDPSLLAPAGGLWALAAALFVMGLAGGATHCAGMCAPFVLVQVAARAESAGGSMLQRLSGAALLPYHLGRMTGYAALGGAVGGLAGLLAMAAGAWRWPLAVLLALAALLLLMQGMAGGWAGMLPRLPAPALPEALRRWAGPLLSSPGGGRGFLLGLLLSALPCGLLYGALAAAAAAGSAWGGALTMAAFCAGTVPGLVGVGLLGRLFGRRFGPVLRPAARLLSLANAGALAAMAAHLVLA